MPTNGDARRGREGGWGPGTNGSSRRVASRALGEGMWEPQQRTATNTRHHDIDEPHVTQRSTLASYATWGSYYQFLVV